MLTPIEIQRKNFKSGGLGYDKKEVDTFLEEVCDDYEALYKENAEYKDKINVLSDGLQYYKSIEKTLQKALVLAQKTADDTHADAVKKADAIEMEAHLKAEEILAEARRELSSISTQTRNLIASYESFKAQLKALANSELEIADSKAMDAAVTDLNGFLALEKPLKDKEIVEREKAMDLTSETADRADEKEDDDINISVSEDTMDLEDLRDIKEKVNTIEKADS